MQGGTEQQTNESFRYILTSNTRYLKVVLSPVSIKNQ